MIMASERDVAVGEFIRMLQDAPPLGLATGPRRLVATETSGGGRSGHLTVSAAMAELDALSCHIKGLLVTAGG
jgi:hypothetical protein